MKRNLSITLVALMLASLLTACVSLPVSYSAESITATVVDADTGAPLEGVIVVAHWQLEHGTFGGNVPAGQLMVMEAVTDKDGVFHFPAWGPKTVWNDFLVHYDPRIILFKPGYEFRLIHNTYSGEPELRSRKQRRSEWNNREIVLRPMKNIDTATVFKNFMEYNGKIDRYFTSARSPCSWMYLPSTLRQIAAERKRFVRLGVDFGGDKTVDQRVTDSRNYEYWEKNCGKQVKVIIGEIVK